MNQSEQKSRRCLTAVRVRFSVDLSSHGQVVLAGERENTLGFENNDFRIHSRNVYVSLLRRYAGVSSGLTTEANFRSRQPTRYDARWVFAFPGEYRFPTKLGVLRWRSESRAVDRFPMNERSGS